MANLEDVLNVPSYPQNIFSVQVATEKGSTFIFRPGSQELITPDGTEFNIEQIGKLYYLYTNMSAISPTWACDLKQWQEILGHCNISDAMKLEHVADGMKITDKTLTLKPNLNKMHIFGTKCFAHEQNKMAY